MLERILFIDVENDRVQYGKSQLRAHWCHHPLGLMYLASAVTRAFPHIATRIFHTITHDYPLECIESELKKYDPDLVGLRSLSVAQEMFKRVARLIREVAPHRPLVAGGPYPSSSYEELVRSGLVDLAVIGEGEKTVVEVVEHLREEGRLPLACPGTAVLEGGLLKVNPPRPFITDLDSLPFPNYELLNVGDYRGFSNFSFQDTSASAFIYNSRGCPYQCFYCHQMFGKKVRRRSGGNVVMEMREHVEKRGIRNFVFVDDLFNVPLEKAKETLSLIARELPGVRINFSNGLRADQMDEEIIDLFERAGTVHMALAVETASPRLQQLIGKNLNIERARKCIESASKRFIATTYFMVGFPTETLEEALQTIAFAEQLNYLAEPTLSVVRVYKGTALYRMLNPNDEQARSLAVQEQAMVQPKLFDDQCFYGDLFPAAQVPLKSQDIETLRWEWMRRVFNNPERIVHSHRIVQKHLHHDGVLEFYRNLYDNPHFDEKNLKRLLHVQTA